MTFPLTPSTRSLLKQRLHRFAHCWRITRTDGTIIRTTDHDVPLTVGTETFAPASGFTASARQKQAGLAEQNFEVIGVLDSDAITDDDLRLGLYNGAQIDELLVDWLYPWAGALISAIYFVESVSFTGERWQAQVAGLTSKIRRQVGQVYSRLCRYDLGDSRCRFDLATETILGAVVSTVTIQRREFTAAVLAGTKADDFYAYGRVTWLTGINAGHLSEAAEYVDATGLVLLRIQTPNDIGIGDTFDVEAGCDKTRRTCIDKFDILVNFGGFPFIPGTDRAVQAPIVK